jgi:SNF family Na+-dependent transporter
VLILVGFDGQRAALAIKWWPNLNLGSLCSAATFDPLLGWVVKLSTETAQPLLGMMLCLYAGWLFNRDQLLAEIKQGNLAAEQGLFWRVWPFYVRLVCPLLIALMLADQWLG